MWLREKIPSNIVINDPKGELLQKFYVQATYRGYQPVQFNLINPLNTDIYNPLVFAVEAAREGDRNKAAQYVENIAEIFFPVDGGDDPVWPNAANNAFKRAVYGMIDFYMEEEADLRRHAAETNMDNKTLETKLDELWGKVTLYNCYQFFVQLTSKKLKNPLNVMSQELKQNEDKYKKMPVDEYNEMIEKCEKEAELWQDKPEADLMTLYFNATAKLPQSLCRNLVMNADNALRSIGGAEKMLSSVYGIAVTAMVRFVGIYLLK